MRQRPACGTQDAVSGTLRWGRRVATHKMLSSIVHHDMPEMLKNGTEDAASKTPPGGLRDAVREKLPATFGNLDEKRPAGVQETLQPGGKKLAEMRKTAHARRWQSISRKHAQDACTWHAENRSRITGQKAWDTTGKTVTRSVQDAVHKTVAGSTPVAM